jgi:hypothetical protein
MSDLHDESLGDEGWRLEMSEQLGSVFNCPVPKKN